jgi:hypothetical protein
MLADLDSYRFGVNPSDSPHLSNAASSLYFFPYEAL